MLILARRLPSNGIDTLHIHSSRSGKQNGFWMSVGIEAEVSSGDEYAGRPQGAGGSGGHWCLDGCIASPISISFTDISDKGSAYTSRTCFLGMKS